MASLSIVIPAYNEQNHLRECLESIAAQTEKPDEVIVVDNNSTDDTVAIAKNYHFVTLLVEKKQGVFYARNTGFDAVKSDIIGRIDADSILTKDWVKTVKKSFKDPEIAAVTGPAFFYDMPLAPKNYIADHAFKNPLYKFDKNFPFLFGTNMAMRSDNWKMISSYVCSDPRVHEDMDLAIHLYRDGHDILYNPKLRVGMSTRRYDDSPRDFYNYITMLKSSYEKHNMKPIGSHVAIAGFTLGYVMLWPLRRSYDDTTKKRSLGRLIRGNKPRKNPNAT